MKRAICITAVILGWASVTRPQVTATVKPVSISGAGSALGNKTIGIWTVSLYSRYPVPVSIPHERLTQSFPLLRDLPNRLAEDLLLRQSSTSFWSIVARWGPTVLTLAGAAYGTHGAATGNLSQVWIGQGAQIAPLVFGRASARAPNPSVYFSDFCPATIALPPYGAFSCLIASGRIPNASPMTALIDVPGVALPPSVPPAPDPH